MPRVDPECHRVPSWAALVLVLLSSAFGASPVHAAAGPVDIRGRLEGLGVLRFDEDSPRQRPLGRLDLSATQRWTDTLKWKLSAVGRVGGPPFNPRAGAFVYDRTFQNYAPSIELGEAWVEYANRHANVRVGTQKFRWGVLDVIRPNDQLNPREYEDPFLTEERDRKIAVPALSVDIFAPPPSDRWRTDDLALSLVWEPVAVPWRFPLPGERWFAPAALSADTIAVGALPGTPCPCVLPVTQVARNASAPARQFDNGNVGVRLGGTTAGVDWHVMLFDGYDPAPSFDTRIELGGTEDAPRVDTQLQPAYIRYPTVGADLETDMGDWVVRGEAAFKFQRPWSFELDQLTKQIVNDPDAIASLIDGQSLTLPTYVLRDAVEWGIGADSVFGATTAIVELYQVLLFNNDVPLLVRDVDTRVSANAQSQWFRERLLTDLLGVWGIDAGYALVRAEASFAWTDGIRLELGLLGIWGNRDSLVGQYERNSQAYGRVTYTF